jgi:hypothetical protein
MVGAWGMYWLNNKTLKARIFPFFPTVLRIPESARWFLWWFVKKACLRGAAPVVLPWAAVRAWIDGRPLHGAAGDRDPWVAGGQAKAWAVFFFLPWPSPRTKPLAPFCHP